MPGDVGPLCSKVSEEATEGIEVVIYKSESRLVPLTIHDSKGHKCSLKSRIVVSLSHRVSLKQ